MPAGVDESKWAKAKAIADDSDNCPEQGSDGYWAYVRGVYNKMTGVGKKGMEMDCFPHFYRVLGKTAEDSPDKLKEEGLSWVDLVRPLRGRDRKTALAKTYTEETGKEAPYSMRKPFSSGLEAMVPLMILLAAGGGLTGAAIGTWRNYDMKLGRFAKHIPPGGDLSPNEYLMSDEYSRANYYRAAGLSEIPEHTRLAGKIGAAAALTVPIIRHKLQMMKARKMEQEIEEARKSKGKT